MKLAVSMWCYVRSVQDGDMDLTGFVDEAANIGAEGVELLDFFYKNPEAERESVKDRLSSVGLPCAVFSVANNFAKVVDSDRKAQVNRIKFGVDEACFFGAQVVRVFAGDISEGITYDQAWRWIVEGLAESADYAQSKGIKLALENHGKLAGKGSQVRDIVGQVRDRCGHDALGANPDTGNFLLVDQDPVEAVTEVADLAYMCHFKDFEPGPGVFSSLAGLTYTGAVIGEGEVDLGGCASSLRDAGFDGWFSLEYEGTGDPRAEVKRSLANARRILNIV